MNTQGYNATGYNATDLLKFTSYGSKSGVVSESALNSLRGRVTVIAPDEFKGIREAAEPEHQKIIDEENKRARMARQREAIARGREETLKAIKPRCQTTLSPEEREAQERALALKEKAQRASDENEDFVKKLNSLTTVAKTLTVRKRQDSLNKLLSEDKIREREEEAASVREAHARYIDAERVRMDEDELKRTRAGEALKQQIEERRESELLDKELKLQEAEKEKARIAAALHEERAQTLRHIELERKLIEDSKKVNEITLEIKKQQKLAEKEEDNKIHDYLVKKAEEELEREEEEKRKKREKDILHAKLGQQNMRRSEQRNIAEEMRLRHAKEMADRKFREQKALEERKREMMENELKGCLDIQLMEKYKKQQQEKDEKLEEYGKALDVKDQHEKDLQRDFLKTQRSKLSQRAALDNQIAERKPEVKQPLRTKEEEDARKSRLERIKNERLTELRAAGVPEEYLYDIKRLNVF